MEDGFDKELLSLSSSMKNGYTFLAKNAGKAIALITLAVCTLVIFADIALADFTSAGFTTMLVAMLCSSYIIYFSLEDSGEKIGEGTEEYKEALEKYKSAKARVGINRIRKLRAFCKRYALEELEFRRSTFIAEAGYTEEEYESFKRGEKCTLRELKIFSKARKMKAVKLTPALLLSGASSSGSCELENPEKKKFLYAFLRLIPSSVCRIFTVSVILTVRGDLSPSVIIDGIIKLSALPIIGFRGYSAGYSFVKDKKSAWLETKARLLLTFAEEAERDEEI